MARRCQRRAAKLESLGYRHTHARVFTWKLCPNPAAFDELLANYHHISCCHVCYCIFTTTVALSVRVVSTPLTRQRRGPMLAFHEIGKDAAVLLNQVST
jgi:hypothetical protein